MNIFNIAFYLTFFVVVLEIAKMASRNLKKSNILFITQLGILALASLTIICYGTDKLFVVFPILLFIAVIIDLIGTNRDIKLYILKIIVALSLITTGIYFIICGG